MKTRQPYTPADPVYKFIREYRRKQGFAPTIREIGVACNLSTTAVHNRLKNLEQDNLIARQPGSSRTIVIVR